VRLRGEGGEGRGRWMGGEGLWGGGGPSVLEKYWKVGFFVALKNYSSL